MNRVAAIFLLLPALLLVFPSVYGAEAVASKDLLSAGYFFQVFGSLLLVLGLVFGLLFLLRKINGLPSGSKATIRVLGSVRLGSREKMILVQAGEQQLLIGVAPGGISTLHTFEKPIEGVADPAALPGGVKSGIDFASLLGKSKKADGDPQ